MPPLPAREVRPEPQTLPETLPETHFSPKPLVLAAVALAVVACALWLIIGLSKTGRSHSALTSPQLTKASQLITQADADAARFQQTELTPEQADTSLQTRTTQYQEAQRLCQLALALGADHQTATGDQQGVARGLHQVQADKEAQSARLLTAEIGASIALYKHQVLTDAQATHIRAKLRTDCGAALADCADALKDDPANAVAWAARVRALRFMGEAKAADAALAHALTLAPGNPVLLTQGVQP
jgi:tetratricopeptide (TPR) repeat protein